MNTRIFIPGFTAFWDFEDFVADGGYFPGQAFNLDRMIRENLFWVPIGGGPGPTSILEESPSSLLLAEELLIHQGALEIDSEHELRQFFFHNVEIWERLFELPYISRFNPRNILPDTRERLFRETTEAVHKCVALKAYSLKLELASAPPLDFCVWAYQLINVILNFRYSQILGAIALWPSDFKAIAQEAVELLEAENFTHTVNNSMGYLLTYEAVVPRIEVFDNLRRVDESDKLRTAPEMAALRKVIYEFSSSTDMKTWTSQYAEIGRALEVISKKRRTATRVTTIVGVGLGIAGLFYLPAGVAGIGLCVGAPILDSILGNNERVLTGRHPVEASVFSLSNIVRNRWSTTRDSVGLQGSAREFNQTSFMESVSTYRQRGNEKTQYCIASTKSGRLCSRKARNGLFCLQHRQNRNAH